MDNKTKYKNMFLLLLVLFVGMLVAGGTYAYLTTSMTVTNGNYVANTTCFDIDYLNTDQITGTLFPSANHTKGLSGTVSLKVNSACNVNGNGRIYIHINDETSEDFGDVAEPHCENPETLETLSDYTTSNDCTTNDGEWVTNGTVLKYAVYDNASGVGTPVDVGYFDADNIGDNMLLSDYLVINRTQSDYYIFLWLDGYLTDNTYVDLTFSGYIWAEALQSEEYELPREYQRVEFIQSTGTQYINTGTPLFSTTSHKIQIDFMPTQLYNYNSIWGSSYDNDTYESWIYSSGSLAGRYNKVRYSTDNVVSVNTRYSVDYIKEGTQLSKYVNGSLIGSATASLRLTDADFYLFRSGSDYGKYKLYSCLLYQDGKLIRNLVPCYRKSDDVRGLYDIVEGVFYVNAGSGTFTKGANVN